MTLHSGGLSLRLRFLDFKLPENDPSSYIGRAPYANGLLAVLSQPPETISALPPSTRRCCEYSNLIRQSFRVTTSTGKPDRSDPCPITKAISGGMGTQDGQSAELKGVLSRHLKDLPDEEKFLSTVLKSDITVRTFSRRLNLHASSYLKPNQPKYFFKAFFLLNSICTSSIPRI
ncbi:hypothetical protein EC919_104247 [Pseudomonas graminis]|nr:hypothetical protein EC919_104247 [Pseudomonas graminis]